jgi:hypothetical protein
MLGNIRYEKLFYMLNVAWIGNFGFQENIMDVIKV